ncbi:MAG: cell surface protein SprA, partial [Bacteroidota bacterium]
QDVRNILAFSDLGESSPYLSTDYNTSTLISPGQLPNPDNENNLLYNNLMSNQEVLNFTNSNGAIQALGYGLRQGVHYERVGNARKLTASEYTFNSRLGFISLKQALNNAEVLAVAYEYTLNGQTFQVGTLSQDGIVAPQALVLKMLKSSITTVRLSDGNPAPLWDNMMKNVYNLEAFGIAQENFRLEVWYNNPATGVNMNYIPREPFDGKLLIQVLNLDRIDAQQMSGADGFFDFVTNAATQGGLIDATSGRIFFPVTEPFGSHLTDKVVSALGNTPQAQQVISQVVFQPLYDSTKTSAQINFPQLNRFRIKGQYQSASGSEISLNALNIPQGAVTVTAGGLRLAEGTDYTVNYNLGKVTILNESVLQGGQPIKISVESNSMFNLQYKTLLGSRFDYKFSDAFNVGATVLNLKERPLTQKVNVGDDPVNNAMIGVDMNFQREMPIITKWIDRIPGIQTKEKSSLNFSFEAAKIFPGHARAVSKDGNAYVDDFEGSQSVIDLRALNQWFLASTPKLQSSLFPEGNLEDSLTYGYNRAKLAWYVLDPLFFRTNSLTPASITQDIQSNHFMREVLESEVFPNRQLPTGTPPNIATLDLSFYPSERGQYNYELPNGQLGYSAGLNTDGTLKDPGSRWGGIQRALTTTDFEMSNVQFIQFWLMDPFNEDSQNITGGDLYFNLGNVSEDVLNDSQMGFENGFPSANNDLPTGQGTWGIFPSPTTFNVVNAFDNTVGNYQQQDIGLDGLNSNAEQSYFNTWLQTVQGFLDASAYTQYAQDPSADNFKYFRSSAADQANLNTLEGYKFYNGYEGN